jgi:hypothetical protein
MARLDVYMRRVQHQTQYLPDRQLRALVGRGAMHRLSGAMLASLSAPDERYLQLRGCVNRATHGGMRLHLILLGCLHG